MKRRTIYSLAAAILFLAVSSFYFDGRSSAQETLPHEFSFELADVTWQTIVHNGIVAPNSENNFNSYGQPSVNKLGTVVFRARTAGGHTGRQTGIYFRDIAGGTVIPMADLTTFVPAPNNLGTKFREFPSIPRIAMNADLMATRGIHSPVYTFLLPDNTETRAGTTGIYAQLGLGIPRTGASKLGAVPGFDLFAVPGTTDVPFDVFPGSPAIADDGTVVFKGNFTIDGVGKTGIFFRRLTDTEGGGTAATEMIASSDTPIPNLPNGVTLNFGSTAPPSVAGTKVVFVGLDNEENPSYGGIYLAPIQAGATLQPIIMIGSSVPGTDLPALTKIGEGISYDGQYIAFWGAWGTATKTVRLYCPTDGNADLRAFCNGDDPLSVYDPVADRWYQEKQVPVDQGIFVYDIRKGKGYLAAGTNVEFNDFLFWGYSGKAPGEDFEEDAELPRWRSAAFAAVSAGRVVFKARTGVLENNTYLSPVDGIYYKFPEKKNDPMLSIAETGMDGSLVSESLGAGEMPVVGLGIERESFRGDYLAITVSMANTEEGWAGVYLANTGNRLKAK